MNLTRKESRRERGGILVVTLVVSSLIGIMLACYLKMVSSQSTYTFRSQVWNSAIPLCEAGVEEALAHLNAIGTNNNFGLNGWTAGVNGFVKERTLDDGTYVAIINTNFPPIITVHGRVPAPLQTARYISRSVQVQTKWNRKFPQAVYAKSRVELGGTSSRIDSFISTNVPGGQYDISVARDEAPVACLASSPGNFNIGSTKVYGWVGYGPGGNVSVSGSGAVGDSTWVASNTGIQEGHSVDDVNFSVSDVVFPSPFGPVLAPGSGAVGGVDYKYIFNEGDYQMSSLSLGGLDKALVLGNARLYVQGETSVTGQGYIQIAASGNFTMYCGGNVDIRGLGVVNLNGYASNFSLNGLTTCTSIEYSGLAKFIGTIYAPQATVKISGTTDTVGAVVADRFDFNGGFQFHYDETLQGKPETGRFIAGSWVEL
jgi:hypothetical protein